MVSLCASGSTKMNSIAILICVENVDLLEIKTLMLIDSIRNYGGRLSTADIHSFTPRETSRITKATLDDLGSLNVTIHLHNLNIEFPQDPLVNKIVAGRWAEQNLNNDVIIFLDSDMIILQEPSELLDVQYDIAVRPLYTYTDENWESQSDYWAIIYNKMGLTYPRDSYHNGHRHYYNSGLIAVKRNIKLFSYWYELYKQIQISGIKTPNRYTEESLLGAAVAGAGATGKIKTHPLPLGYNYEIWAHNKTKDEHMILSWDDLYIVHYQKMFDSYPKLPDLEGLEFDHSYVDLVNNLLEKHTKAGYDNGIKYK